MPVEAAIMRRSCAEHRGATARRSTEAVVIMGVKEAVSSGAVHGCYGLVAATNNTRESLPMSAGLDPASWRAYVIA